jgi:hypothetical protein
MNRISRCLALVACVVVFASCRVDVAVDMAMEPDGTGTITVVATADADIVSAVPTIADELALDDVVAAGWIVEGPTATPDGGLTITITHPFTSAEDATNLLNSVGPPFNQMSVSRATVNSTTTTKLGGLLGLSNGFAAFADDDLVTAVGSLPFAEQIEASGATPESSLDITIRASLPGVIVTDETNGKVGGAPRGQAGGTASGTASGTAIDWVVPLDGSISELRGVSEQAPANNAWWARPLSIASLVALVGWVVFMVVFIGYVTWARSQRARRYRRRPRPAGPAPSADG